MMDTSNYIRLIASAYRKLFVIILLIILLVGAIIGFVIGNIFDAAGIGFVVGIIIGFLIDVFWGGLTAIFLNIDENIEKLVNK